MENYYTFNNIKKDYCDSKASAEAIEFIKNLPANFVDSQKNAILNALNSNSSELDSIRLARKKLAPENSKNVDVKDIYIVNFENKNLRLRIFEPKNTSLKKRNVLLYIHGGGWTISCPEACAKFCCKFCEENNAIVIAPDYRLAPEHPYPCANLDCISTYEWIVENLSLLNANPEKIMIAGDSAGGHLAIETSIQIANDAKFSIKLEALIAFYPVTDLTNFSTKSYKFFGKNFCLDAELMKLFIKSYIQDKISAKEASPLFKDLSNLPRTLIISSECDILRDEAQAFYQKLKLSNPKTRYVCIEGATHIFITQSGMNNAFNTAFSEALKFANKA